MPETTNMSGPRKWDPGITIKLNGDPTRLDAPTFDPSADFQVAGSGQPDDPNFGGVPDAAPRAESVAGVPNDAPRVSTGAAFGLGAASGLTANFADEIYGLGSALAKAQSDSPVPAWVPGAQIAGLARLIYENTIGTPGEVTKAYQSGRDRVRQLQKAASEQHPRAYTTGLVGGAAATVFVPGVPVMKGVGLTGQALLKARAANAGANGFVAGGLYGAGEGRGAKDTLAKAGIGAVLGGAGGAVAGPVVGGVLDGAGKGFALLASKNPQFAQHPWLMRVVPNNAAPRAVGAGLVSRIGPRVSDALDLRGTGRIGIFAPADEPPPEPAWSGIP